MSGLLTEGWRRVSISARLIAIRHLARRWADNADLALDSDRTIRDAVRDSFRGLVHDVPIAVLAQWIEDGPTSRSEHFAGPHRSWYAGLSRADRRLLLSSCRRRLPVVEAALAAANLAPDGGEEYWESENPLIKEHRDLACHIILFGG